MTRQERSRSDMPRDLPLDTSATVTLDGSGKGTVILVPNVGQRWKDCLVSVAVSSSNNVPEFRFYKGNVAQSSLVDGTFTGNLNSSDALHNVVIPPGVPVIGVWANGDPGASATMSIRGMVTVP